MTERYLETTDPIVEAFTALPIDAVTQLPLRALTPTIIDDMTSSHTPGPIEVYALRARKGTAQQIGRVALWIADGNHRYFEAMREGHTTIVARKVIPDAEHDIRVMFNAHDAWEDV